MQANLQNWRNDPTALRPVDVARCFATSNLTGDLFQRAIRSIALFEGGEAKRAKNILDEVPRSEFATGQDYFLWAQFIALFSKSSLKGDMRSREAVALRKFRDAEAACKRANRRLRYYWSRPERENPLYRVILSRARELINKTLGNFSEGTLLQILDWSRPGGGTAIGTCDPGRVTLPWKLGRETRLVCTPAALPYARMLVEHAGPWFRLWAEVDWSNRTYQLPYEVRASNRIAFVPKDAVTMRTIAVEPHLNMCLQLGVCEYLSRRLRSVGIDLRSQTCNQLAARKGAEHWADVDPLVTLDLSSASDTLSIGLVERLLPPMWLGFLRDLRSPSYVLGKESPVEYQKWSSMGNGYTFPLETLIFWALARAVSTFSSSNGDVLVYGDDIVVPRGAAALLIEVLKYCGFSVNRDKSALFGPFRESCGEDWFGTERVVPVYLRYMDYIRPTDIYRVINMLDSRFERRELIGTLLRAHRGIPVLRGLPTGDPTHCIWTSDLRSLRKSGHVQWNSRWQCWVQRVAVFKPMKRPTTAEAAYAAALLGNRGDAAFVPRSTIRRRGLWSLLRVASG